MGTSKWAAARRVMRSNAASGGVSTTSYARNAARRAASSTGKGSDTGGARIVKGTQGIGRTATTFSECCANEHRERVKKPLGQGDRVRRHEIYRRDGGVLRPKTPDKRYANFVPRKEKVELQDVAAVNLGQNFRFLSGRPIPSAIVSDITLHRSPYLARLSLPGCPPCHRSCTSP